jgi:hypothetical protein
MSKDIAAEQLRTEIALFIADNLRPMIDSAPKDVTVRIAVDDFATVFFSEDGILVNVPDRGVVHLNAGGAKTLVIPKDLRPGSRPAP